MMLSHFGGQLNCPAGNHEGAPSEMMNGPRAFHRRVDPRLDYFKDEEAIPGDHPGIDNLAFEIRIALVNQRRLDSPGGHRRETKSRELVDFGAGGVPAAYHLGR